MEKLKMIRHLEEIENGEMNRNADIDLQEISLLREHYIPKIIQDIETGEYNNIVLISSDKLRSRKTSEILTDELSKRTHVPITQETDSRTSAEIHGKYKEGVSVMNPLVKKAKFIFLHEAFEKGNIWYRHGSVVNDFDSETYPELAEIFEHPGENQIELNIRMYRFIIDLIEKVKENPKTLYVLSTHHIVMSTLLSLMHIIDKKGPYPSLLYHPLGEMYHDENRATEEMLGGWDKFYEFYKLRNYVFDVDISKLGMIEETIESELDISLAKYMQHYGKLI